MNREEYMESAGVKADSKTERTAAHRAYYGQYVDEKVKLLVHQMIGLSNLQKSTDPHFNDIPLRRWDVMVTLLGQTMAKKLKENGDTLSLGSGVCILKEAAHQIVGKRAVDDEG